MILIKNQDEYPRYIGDLQIEFPSFKVGDALPTGWREVGESEYPTHTADQVAYEGLPIEVNGKLVQNWLVRDLTAEEIAFRDAPQTAKNKLIALGLTESEIQALANGLVR